MLSGGIQMDYELSVITSEFDWLARAWPVDDATLVEVGVQVDSNVVRSGPPSTTAADLEIENPSGFYIHGDLPFFPKGG